MITRLGQCLIGAAASISLLATTVQAEAAGQIPLSFPEKAYIQEGDISGQLWRFDVTSERSLRKVLALVEKNGLDLWQATNTHVDVYTPSSSNPLPAALRALSHSEPTNITAPTYGTPTNVDTEWDLPSLTNTTFHDQYHPMFEIESFIKELKELHPDLVTVTNIGHTGAGREMFALTISKPKDGEEEKGREEESKQKKKKKKSGKHTKPHHEEQNMGIVLIGAQHAREWIATASALYLTHALVANETEEYSLRHLLEVFDFHIVPAPNPDGYSYTWESDRYWYKTRQRMGSKGRCFGVDMNRNWGYKWKPHPEYADITKKPKERQPVDPCSDFYPGHRPFEAAEANNIANWVTTIPNAIAFLDLRSYGQMLSTPFSYSCKPIPKDAEDQLEAALGAAQAMGRTHGTSFTTGRLCEMLYHAPGNVIDWMYKRAGIKYSYVLHLRDTGTYGFTLPPQWIRPVGEETSEMVKYLAKFIAKQFDKKL